mgnify:CR=1 FL=1
MLPEKKVKELIGLMNSISSVRIPAMKEVFDLFNMTMDEFMVDFLIKGGTTPKSMEELKSIYVELFWYYLANCAVIFIAFNIAFKCDM